ncbi:MAG: MFS transporter [Planctomycetes bacterium]|nr:MFS transporter [Planctomycetota bacterium]
MSSPAASPSQRLRQVTRALAHRNFRLFFAGQSISLIGTWMQQVALAWVVYLLTRDQTAGNQDVAAYWLGIIGFLSQIPAFFLAPVAGVLVDRWNRHRLILATQTLAMLQAFAVAALTGTDTISIGWIMALSFLLGVVNAVDMPARQAFLSEMVDNKADLSNAISLNSSMFNAARLVGPALAAVLLELVGATICFALNAVSYLAVLGSLLQIHVPRRHLQVKPAGLMHGLREGFGYAFGFPPIRTILLMIGIVSVAATTYNTLLPLVATQMLGGGSGTFGLLTIASGIGALTGAVFLASRLSVRGLFGWIRLTPVLLSAALLVLASSQWLPVSFLALVAVGFAMMVHLGSSNIVLQTIVDEDKRGRVMSLYAMAFLGVGPLGSLLAGFMANRFGPANAIRAGAVICLLGAIYFASQYSRLRTLVRPIYVRLGILPEMASETFPIAPPPKGAAPLSEAKPPE